jgi:4-carboxymuconolactone decarboxylase
MAEQGHPGERFGQLRRDEMTAAQQEFHDLWLASRGAIGGPANFLLRQPALGVAFEALGAHLRFHNALPSKLVEFAIIIVARAWSSSFEWHIHRQLAEKNGLAKETCDAIADGRRPQNLDAGETAIFDFATTLLSRGEVDDLEFASVLHKFGADAVADLVGLIGYYCAISLILNVNRCPVPETAKELRPLPGAFGPACGNTFR